MNVAAVADLLNLLRECHLLEPAQLAEVQTRLAPACTDPRLLAKELVKRSWLTPYQVNEIFVGRGRGLLLGSYVLLEKLGEGGMGAVLKARNWKLGRIVALKLIRKDRLENSGAVQRFQREIRAAAHLDHPNIVHAIDADQVGNVHFFVMEHVDATDLAKLVKKHGPLSVVQACDAIRQAALGLQHAFERGLVHRDIKPHNLLLTKEGVVKILDMGLARFSTSEESLTTLTQEGTVMGTLDYMAPEQALNAHHVDVRADLYSLGCTFHFLLCGQVVFPGGTATEKLLKHQQQPPRPVEEVRLETPAAVSAIIRKLLAKRPEERYQTPLELATALEQAQMALLHRSPSSSPSEGSLTVDWRQVGEAATGETAPPVHVPRLPIPERRKLIAMLTGVALMLAIVGVVIWLASGSLFGPRTGTNADETTAPGTGTPPGTVPPVKTFTNSLGMEFVLVPRGKSWLGGGGGTPGNQLVEVPYDFYLGKYEVTQEEWQKLTGVNPSAFNAVAGIQPEDQKRFPVEQVSWDDCQEFIKVVNAKVKEPGWIYRLPTEAEWEYACRGGPLSNRFESGFHFYFDKPTNTLMPDMANFNETGLKRTCEVGSYQPNRLGLYDMHGNVWEWCEDETKDDKGASRRVSWGGSWRVDSNNCRAAIRNTRPLSFRIDALGLRLARVPVGAKGK